MYVCNEDIINNEYKRHQDTLSLPHQGSGSIELRNFFISQGWSTCQR